MKIYEQEAKEAQIEAGKFGELGGRPKNNEKPLPQKKGKGSKKREKTSKQKAAEDLGVSASTLENYELIDARRLQETTQ